MKLACDNCAKVWPENKVTPLEQCEDLHERLDRGSVVPHGECPDCGAFCYPLSLETRLKEALKAYAEATWEAAEWDRSEAEEPYDTVLARATKAEKQLWRLLNPLLEKAA